MDKQSGWESTTGERAKAAGRVSLEVVCVFLLLFGHLVVLRGASHPSACSCNAVRRELAMAGGTARVRILRAGVTLGVGNANWPEERLTSGVASQFGQS